MRDPDDGHEAWREEREAAEEAAAIFGGAEPWDEEAYQREMRDEAEAARWSCGCGAMKASADDDRCPACIASNRWVTA